MSDMALRIIAESYHLAPEEIDEFRESFDQFDKDKNGHITLEELGDVMRTLGQNPSQTQLKEMIDELDADGSGTVEFHEFLAMYAQQRKGKVTEEEEVLAAFKTFDKNGDGQISASELRHVMQCLGEKLTEAEVQEMITAADVDGNGKIDYNEFAKVILKK